MKLFSKEISESLASMLDKDSKCLLFGEDVEDPYGGAFGITRGLSSRFPDRVRNAPISEAGLLGMCFGIASEGFNVFLELMFGDFSMLTLDQAHNNVSKIVALSDFKSGLIIRTPMGGYRGYGPTHSQTLNRFLVGSDNINVVTSSNFVSPLETFEQAMSMGRPCYYIEDKMTYLQNSMIDSQNFEGFLKLRRAGQPFHDVFFENQINDRAQRVLVICIGGALRIALEAATELLFEEEISIDIFQLNSLWPLNYDEIIRVSHNRSKVVIMEEGWPIYGIGAEIASVVYENAHPKNFPVIRRLGASSTIIPGSTIKELETLPSTFSLVKVIKELIGRGNNGE